MSSAQLNPDVLAEGFVAIVDKHAKALIKAYLAPVIRKQAEEHLCVEALKAKTFDADEFVALMDAAE